MKAILLCALAGAMVVGAGVVHGVWTDRWNDGSDLAAAAKRLDRVPQRVGDWEGKRVDHERDARSGLAGSVTYQFTHHKTGKTVTVFLACGRPGPVSVHTPEVCYAGNGYEVERPVRFTSTKESLQGQTFYTSRLLRKRSDEQNQQRIFWGWNQGNGWEISENPRFAYSGQPILFKMYVIRELNGPSDSLETDPCVELMEALLPEMQKKLF